MAALGQLKYMYNPSPMEILTQLIVKNYREETHAIIFFGGGDVETIWVNSWES